MRRAASTNPQVWQGAQARAIMIVLLTHLGRLSPSSKSRHRMIPLARSAKLLSRSSSRSSRVETWLPNKPASSGSRQRSWSLVLLMKPNKISRNQRSVEMDRLTITRLTPARPSPTRWTLLLWKMSRRIAAHPVHVLVLFGRVGCPWWWTGATGKSIALMQKALGVSLPPRGLHFDARNDLVQDLLVCPRQPLKSFLVMISKLPRAKHLQRHHPWRIASPVPQPNPCQPQMPRVSRQVDWVPQDSSLWLLQVAEVRSRENRIVDSEAFSVDS